MSKFTQYKKLQKYYLGSPVTPAEYKKGDFIMIGDFDSLEICQNDSIPVVYWIYPKGTTSLYKRNTLFTFTLDHTDDDYDYYVINGSGTALKFMERGVISGGSLNTSNLTTMNQMFYRCENLTSLDLSKWDTSNVTDMSYMFYECLNLTEIKGIENLNTSKVTDMDYMFDSCENLTSLDLSGWDTSNLTSMSNMFSWCKYLTSLDLSGWNTNKARKMSEMFYGCNALTSLDLSGWNIIDGTTISDALSMGNMFYGCSLLRTIYMRGCSSDTISKIESQLNYADLLDNVTIVTT